MVAAGRAEIPLRTPARTAAASGEMSLSELGYNWRETTCARSSADRALASGARGQRFESSRAYQENRHTTNKIDGESAASMAALCRIGNKEGISRQGSVPVPQSLRFQSRTL